MSQEWHEALFFGETLGMELKIVSNKPELVKAEFGINEGGGGELRNGKPVLHRIQVAEKMYSTYELEVREDRKSVV